MIDQALNEYANLQQKRVLDAIRKEGSCRKAAKVLGCHHSTVARTLNDVQDKAALQGYSPSHDMTRAVPRTHVAKGVSTNYGPNGEILQQWVKSDLNRQTQLELMLSVLESAAELLPRMPPVKAPKRANSALATVITLTDCHIGMYAWEKEGGDRWDLEIAEKTLVGCFEQLINSSPAADTCIIAQLGDFLHYDGLLAVTPTSGHVLDASGRYPEMCHTAVRVLRRIVNMALAKYPQVKLVLAEGNHDMGSSVWLRIMFKALFENEPRIEIIDNELPYYAYQHGETMLCWHHSHMKKFEQLPLQFATQFSEMWGKTNKRYGHTGDKHHLMVKETSGMIMTQHPTLAARDAYASRHGWHALRTATAITYHDKHGAISSVTVNPEMLT